MRAVGLWILFAIGFLASIIVAIPIFFFSLFRGARAFHPQGTVCEATVTALDNVVGPRLAGPARVRLSGVSAPENSKDQTVLGMAVKFGDNQDLAMATFEAFTQTKAGTANSYVANYLANEFASVSPWRTKGLGVIWYRAMGTVAKEQSSLTRVEQLDAHIANGTAKFVLQARSEPGSDGHIASTVAEILLTKRVPDDPTSFHISMWNSGRGLSATGFRNGVRTLVYPVSQLARGLRGH